VDINCACNEALSLSQVRVKLELWAGAELIELTRPPHQAQATLRVTIERDSTD
jgi:hypothetical protein